LRGDVQLWGVTGYALASCGRYAEAAEWLADWRTRDGVEPWMLSNVVEAGDAQGRSGEALDAVAHALTLRYDSTFPFHILRLACAEAAAGNFAAARGRLNGLRYEVLEDADKALWALANAGCAVAEAAPESRKAEYAKQLGVVRSGARASLRCRKWLRRIAGTVVNRMARDANFAFPRLRAWASRHALCH
jgi:hypothetical protein